MLYLIISNHGKSKKAVGNHPNQEDQERQPNSIKTMKTILRQFCLKSSLTATTTMILSDRAYKKPYILVTFHPFD